MLKIITIAQRKQNQKPTHNNIKISKYKKKLNIDCERKRKTTNTIEQDVTKMKKVTNFNSVACVVSLSH